MERTVKELELSFAMTGKLKIRHGDHASCSRDRGLRIVNSRPIQPKLSRSYLKTKMKLKG
jgi:hypothetical protein